MDNNSIDDFFIPGNAVTSTPDYSLADVYINAASSFANVTYQSVYIIDYFSRGFLFVSDNPLFLCGMTPDQVKSLGYRFYIDHVPADEIEMLKEVNRAGFRFLSHIPVEERNKYTISYDFHLTDNSRSVLVNHKLTGYAFLPDGSLWLALSVVSLSSQSSPGHIRIYRNDKAGYREYDMTNHRWENHDVATLNKTEKTILTLSIKGLTIAEIASQACLAVDSVKSARRRLFQKLEVDNISEAISYATNYKHL